MKNMWLEQSLFKFFDEHAELEVRLAKGVIGDVIRKGVFHTTLDESDFTKEEIREAILLGLIIKTQIQFKDGSHRWVYAYVPKEIDQVTPFKRIVKKVFTMLKLTKGE